MRLSDGGGTCGGGAQRLACELADLFSGVAAQAGVVAHASDEMVSPCEPSKPVNVLQYHGTEDRVILYGGGFNFGHPYPSALESVVRACPVAVGRLCR